MKKLFIFVGAALLGIGAFGVHGKKAEIADATEYTGVAALLNEFAQGKAGNRKYTKKTTIFVRTEVEGYDAAFFHAGNQQFQRTTYYADDILLMGDLNGGFTGINSGYANDGEGNMIHFTSKSGVAALDDPSQWNFDYSVNGKTMSDYFYGLAELADLSTDSTKWTKDGEVYTHTITDLSVSGEYNDPLLKGFQYFAAPMLLTHRASDSAQYFSPSSIKVEKQNGVLSIKILADSDTGKLWDREHPDQGSNLLAEARVYKDIVMPGYFLIGDFSAWSFDNDNRMGNGNAENYAVLEDVVMNSTGGLKAVELQNDGYFGWHGNGSENVLINYTGTYNFYITKNPNGYLYKYAKSVSVPFEIEPINWDEHIDVPSNDNVYIAGLKGWNEEDWIQMTRNGNVFSATVTLAQGDYEYKYVIKGGTHTSTDWDSLNGGAGKPNRQLAVY